MKTIICKVNVSQILLLFLFLGDSSFPLKLHVLFFDPIGEKPKDLL